MDFTQTTFSDQSFTVVWGIESICHAHDKSLFIKEAYRLLKPGGRLVVADGFAINEQYSAKDADHMQAWLKGWGCESLATVEQFRTYLTETGFESIDYRDITNHVLPSSRRLYYIFFPSYICSKIGEWIGLRKPIQTNNIVGAYYQYTTLKKRLWKYGIFTAVKP